MDGRSLALSAYDWFWRGVDSLFPPTCAGCGAAGMRWCPDCLQAITRQSPPFCPKCANPQPVDQICSSCQKRPPSFEFLRAWAIFDGPIQSALHRLKYRRDLGLAEQLAQFLYTAYSQYNWPVSLVIPIPLSLRRYRERGYNQAALMAHPLAWMMGIDFDAHAIRRIRHTRSQVNLSWAERQNNVEGAFLADTHRVTGRQVLLIDDVATTGATLNAAAHALRQAGADRVFALTLARAKQNR